MKLLSFSDAEKKESLKRELIAEKIAQEKEHFKRFVPPKKGLGYVGESSNKGKQVAGSCSSKVPKSTHRKGSQGNSASYKDKKIIQLFRTLQNFIGQGIDFEKRKVYKPFRLGHSKYIDVIDHCVCWHCGFVEHFRHSCPKRRHVWEEFQIQNEG